MTAVSHLDMFYDTRLSMAITDSSPANNPYTELSEVPQAAEIRYEDQPDHTINCEEFEVPNEKGFETARFLISRAMYDPDAVVVPISE